MSLTRKKIKLINDAWYSLEYICDHVSTCSHILADVLRVERKCDGVVLARLRIMEWVIEGFCYPNMPISKLHFMRSTTVQSHILGSVLSNRDTVVAKMGEINLALQHIEELFAHN